MTAETGPVGNRYYAQGAMSRAERSESGIVHQGHAQNHSFVLQEENACDAMQGRNRKPESQKCCERKP
jgi:hypothetical protein